MNKEFNLLLDSCGEPFHVLVPERDRYASVLDRGLAFNCNPVGTFYYNRI